MSIGLALQAKTKFFLEGGKCKLKKQWQDIAKNNSIFSTFSSFPGVNLGCSCLQHDTVRVVLFEFVREITLVWTNIGRLTDRWTEPAINGYDD